MPSGSTFAYEYHLRDHLGNTRATYPPTTNGNSRLTQYTNYYPFGLPIQRRSWQIGLDNPTQNPYLYNGKELHKELNLDWMDYGARFYDGQIGRWHSVDNQSEEYFTFSPYNYTVNNPINAIDPDGERVIYVNGHWNRLLNFFGLSPGVSGQEYWSFFSQRFLSGSRVFIGAQQYEESVFVDGSSAWGGDQSGGDRNLNGWKYAHENYSTLIKGLKADEPFRFVSHSEGGAFAAGIASYLMYKGHKVECMLFLSPDEADEFIAPLGTYSVQVHYENDQISPSMRLGGVDVYANFNSINGKECTISNSHGATVLSATLSKLLSSKGPYANVASFSGKWNIVETKRGYTITKVEENENDTKGN